MKLQVYTTVREANCVQVNVELGHRAIPKEKPMPNGFTHEWTVFVRGPDNASIHFFIEKVVFYLHESFQKPKRVLKEPPYEVSESGYGGFMMGIDVHFRNGAHIRYDYDLYLGLNEAITNIRPEKVTFPNPSEEFRIKLLRGGGIGVLNADENLIFHDRLKTAGNFNLEDTSSKRSPSSGYAGGKGPGNVPASKSKDSSVLKNRPTKSNPFSELFGEPTSVCCLKSEPKKEGQRTNGEYKVIPQDSLSSKRYKEPNRKSSSSKPKEPLPDTKDDHKLTKKKSVEVAASKNRQSSTPHVERKHHHHKTEAPSSPNKKENRDRKRKPSDDIRKEKKGGSKQLEDHQRPKPCSKNEPKKSSKGTTYPIHNPLKALEAELDESSSSELIPSDCSDASSPHSSPSKRPHAEPKASDTNASKSRSHKNSHAYARDEDDLFNPEYIHDLKQLQLHITNLTDGALAQAVVDIVEETGRYSIGSRTVDFDLCQLGTSAIQKLKKCLALA